MRDRGKSASDPRIKASGKKVSIGDTVTNAATENVQIGSGANANSAGNVAIGTGAVTGTNAKGVAIGQNAEVSGANSVAIGTDSEAGAGSVAIGREAGSAVTTGSNNIFIGDMAGIGVTTGTDVIAIGKYTARYDNKSDLIAIGANGAGGYSKSIELITSDQALRVYNKELTLNGTPVPLEKNVIHNGGFRVSQRGNSFTSSTTPANNDDTYIMDRWILLSDGNNVVNVARGADWLYDGSDFAKFTVVTANKKFGIVQILDFADSSLIANGTKPLYLGFDLATSGSTLRNVKAAILYTDQVAHDNVVTSDVVDTWETEGVNPIWATGWTEAASSANLWTTTGTTRVGMDAGYSLGSATNVAVVIWCDDDSTTVGNWMSISKVQLHESYDLMPWQPVAYEEELARCQRYYYRHVTGSQQPVCHGIYLNSDEIHGVIPFPTTMRDVPVLDSATGTNYYTAIGSGQPSFNSLALELASTKAAHVACIPKHVIWICNRVCHV